MAESKLVGVDVGGTFTDLVLVDELTGDVRVAKVPTTAAAGRPAGFHLALALIARRLDLGPTGAGDLLLLGRLVGLLAHAVDQATDGSPIRARLRYVGPEPGAH